MKTKQLGFTLIELVVVIVLLGIIGAVATARFQDLSADAADATEQGVAAEISSASAINYAASRLGGAAVAITGTVDCTATGADTVSDLLQSGLPANITLADSGGMACGGAGSIVQCTVSHASGTAADATATVICTG
jgi:prepilin-type N-terminal cleavage/methylation domain-containing protein